MWVSRTEHRAVERTVCRYAQLIAEPFLQPFNILVSIKMLKYICILTYMYIDICI